MFIKKLFIKNFQSHKASTIQFDKGLNCVVGSTNSGKSSVIRALKYILFGEPSWEKGFVRKGKSSSNISIEIGDHTVERSKGEDINEYSLDGVKYQSFGVGVPADIKNTLRLNTVDFEDQEINLNFADQLDSLFLIDEPDSVKARLLNKLSGLDVIDNVMKSISDDKRTCASEIKILDKDNEETKEILKKYKDIDLQKNAVYELDLITGQFEGEYLKLEKLYKIKDNINNWKIQKGEVKELQDRLDILDKVNCDEVAAGIEDAWMAGVIIDNVKGGAEVIRKSKADIESLTAKFEKYKGIEIESVENDIEKCEDMLLNIEWVATRQADNLQKSTEIDQTAEALSDTEDDYEKTLKEYGKLLEKSKVCPTCGSSITKDMVDECLKNL